MGANESVSGGSRNHSGYTGKLWCNINISIVCVCFWGEIIEATPVSCGVKFTSMWCVRTEGAICGNKRKRARRGQKS